MKDSVIENSNFARRKGHFFRNLLIFTAAVAFVALVVFGIIFSIRVYNKNHITLKTIRSCWETFDYEGVYETSRTYLQENPYSNTALTYHGYACFFLAEAQTDSSLAQEYLDECINTIRVALYDARPSLIPQLYYILGKAYFYKDTVSSYYYSDLAVKYLMLAKESGYEADDIAEYLGLSYAALGDTMQSISSFTEALLVRESDFLLLSIAEQYFKAGEYAAAEQYLFRIVKNSDNDDIVIKSMLLIGSIAIEKNDLDTARRQFEAVLEKNPASADAHYGLGVVYEGQNNMVKARAEWRQALKNQANHQGALKKLSDN